MCWAPGGFMSTVKHSVVGMRGYGHGCAMAGGEKLSAATASVLEEEIGPGKRGKQHRSSQRVQRWPRRARGGTEADEFDEDGRRSRG